MCPEIIDAANHARGALLRLVVRRSSRSSPRSTARARSTSRCTRRSTTRSAPSIEGIRNDAGPPARHRDPGARGSRERCHRAGAPRGAHPVRDRGPRRSAVPARGARRAVVARGGQGRHGQSRDAAPAHRPALAHRPARPRPARSPCLHAERSTSRGSDDPTLAAELARAVEGTDPTEIVALADAVDDPGDLRLLRRGARQVRRDLSQLIASVRAHVSEPLLELARRAIRALDLDIELEAGDVSGGADNIALFLEAVADYAGSRSLRLAVRPGGLPRRRGVLQRGHGGLDAVRGRVGQAADDPRAKGLEWHTRLRPARVRHDLPLDPRPRPVDHQRADPAHLAARRSRPACPTSRTGRRPTTRRSRRRTAPTRDGGTSAGLRRLHPRRPAPRRQRALVGPHAAEAARTVDVPRRDP